jgi:glycosyltransferase involved in cell wall biosynthesis
MSGKTIHLRKQIPNTEGGGGALAICVPCYNEALTIGTVVDDFAAVYPHAVIYVYDNNSTDDTAKIAREHNAIVRFEPRQGKGNVIRQMLRDIDADYYLLIDGDNAFSAQDAPKLLEPVMNNAADMAIGDRLTSGIYAERNQRKLHGFGNGLVKLLIKWIYGVKIFDVMTGYRASNRAFAKTFPILSTGFELETEMTIHAIDKNFRIVQVPIEFKERPEGSVSTLNTFWDGLKVLGMIFRLFKDYRPLSFFMLIGIVFCIAGVFLWHHGRDGVFAHRNGQHGVDGRTCCGVVYNRSPVNHKRLDTRYGCQSLSKAV